MSEQELEILEKAVRLELLAMHFYRCAQPLVSEEGLRDTFRRLEKEEEEHARSLHCLLVGLPALDTLFNQMNDRVELKEMTEEQILERALHIELSMEQAIRKTLQKTRSPALKKIFADNARDTLRHYHHLSSEYTRLFMKVPRLDLGS